MHRGAGGKGGWDRRSGKGTPGPQSEYAGEFFTSLSKASRRDVGVCVLAFLFTYPELLRV